MNPPRPPNVFPDADPQDDDLPCEPTPPPSRWEVDDEPAEDIVNADEVAGAEAQTLALRYGLDETLPTQAAHAPGQTMRAVILDAADGEDWELNVLEFAAGDWFAVLVLVPSNDAAGLARAAAWLLKYRSPLWK